MGWSELSKINLKSRENVVLYWSRRYRFLWGLGAGILLAIGIFSWLYVISLDTIGDYYGRGAQLLALFLLLPVALRIIVAAIFLGGILEVYFHHAQLIYSGLPAYVVGPDGIAALNPWKSRALTWREIRACSRHSVRDVWGNEEQVELRFGPPDRQIVIRPRWVGMTEQELVKTIERFAGRIVFDNEVTSPTDYGGLIP